MSFIRSLPDAGATGRALERFDRGRQRGGDLGRPLAAGESGS